MRGLSSQLLWLVVSFLLFASVSSLATPGHYTSRLQPRRPKDDGDSINPGIVGLHADYEACDYSVSYETLDDLNADITGKLSEARGTIRSDCIAVYALDALITMLDTAYKNYTDVNKGYDEEFGYYIKYMEKLVPSILDNSFMFDTSEDTPTMAMSKMGPAMKCMYLS